MLFVVVVLLVAVGVLYHDVLVLVARVNALEEEVRWRRVTGTIREELP
jgi:hypothetical protein